MWLPSQFHQRHARFASHVLVFVADGFLQRGDGDVRLAAEGAESRGGGGSHFRVLVLKRFDQGRYHLIAALVDDAEIRG